MLVLRFVMVVLGFLGCFLEVEAEATGVRARLVLLVVPRLAAGMVPRLSVTTPFDCTFLGIHCGRDLRAWVGEGVESTLSA